MFGTHYVLNKYLCLLKLSKNKRFASELRIRKCIILEFVIDYQIAKEENCQIWSQDFKCVHINVQEETDGVIVVSDSER